MNDDRELYIRLGELQGSILSVATICRNAQEALERTVHAHIDRVNQAIEVDQIAHKDMQRSLDTLEIRINSVKGVVDKIRQPVETWLSVRKLAIGLAAISGILGAIFRYDILTDWIWKLFHK